MANTLVSDLLVRLNVDPAKWKSGLADAAGASKKFGDQLKAHQAELAKLTLASGLTLASQIAFIKDVTGEFAKQETAVNKLNVLLRAEQRTRSDSIDVLTKQADALQKITPFADEAIISMQATAAAFKLTDSQIEQLTPSLLDAAAGFRDVEGNALDLDTVAKAVGKAIDGNATALKKMGIDVKLTGDQTQDFNTVLEALKSRFDGAAVAAGETFAGKMKIASNQISEVKEQIGAALAPAILSLAEKIVPLVTKFGEWATAHKDIVLAIVGGGVAGAGLLSALAAVALAIGTLGAAAGPVGIAIVSIATLVGWLIKLKLASDDIPTSINGINDALVLENKYLAELIAHREKLMTAGSKEFFLASALPGGLAGQLGKVNAEIAETEKRLNDLREAMAKLSGASSGAPSRGSLLGKAGATTTTTGGGETTVGTQPGGFVGPLRDPMEPIGPRETEGFDNEEFRRQQEEQMDINEKTVDAITEKTQEGADARALIRQQEHDAQVANMQVLLGSWESTFVNLLAMNESFGSALLKSSLLTVVKVVHAKIQEGMAELLVTKLKEVGKAMMQGPLSFGASLAAIPPILAAYGAAAAGMAAVESSLSKGSRETGGVITETGHWLMHEGEVVINPRRNSLSDAARFANQAGAPNLAQALSGGGRGGSGDTIIDARLTNYGPIRYEADMDDLLRRFVKRLDPVPEF